LVIPDLASGAGLTGLSYDPSTGVIGTVQLAGGGATGTVGGTGIVDAVAVWSDPNDLTYKNVNAPVLLLSEGGATAGPGTTGHFALGAGVLPLTQTTTSGPNVVMGYVPISTAAASGDIGSRNVILGSNNLSSTTIGPDDDNVLIGTNIGGRAEGFRQSILIGQGAASGSTVPGGYRGSGNVIMGVGAVNQPATTSNSVYIGLNAAAVSGGPKSGTLNVGIGNSVLRVSDSAQQVTAMGALAGQNLTSGDLNTLVGYDAAPTLVTGQHNTVISGDVAVADATDAIAIGLASSADSGSVVIGRSAAGATGTVVVGLGASGAAANDVVIGPLARTLDSGGGVNVVIGRGARVTGNSSVAVGNNCNVTNSDAFAFGNSCSVSGEFATAIGSAAAATADYAIAIGTENAQTTQATATGAIALGQSVLSSGTRAIGIGAENSAGVTASGDDSIAIGTDVEVSANNAIGIGRSVLVNRAGSIAIGDDAAAGTSGISIGCGVTGTTNSVVIGHQASAGGPNCVIIGNGATGSTGNIVVIGAGATGSIDGDIVLNNAYRDSTQRLVIPDLALATGGLTGIGYNPTTGVFGTVAFGGGGLSDIGINDLTDAVAGAQSNLILGITGPPNASADSNVIVGRVGAGNVGTATGDSNIIMGNGSAAALTSGGSNVVVGATTAAGMTSASSNVIIGNGAASSLTTANTCIIIGAGAGTSLTTGTSNVLIGPSNPGDALTNGTSNVLVGSQAGSYLLMGASNNIAIGRAANGGAVTTDLATMNSICIGDVARARGTNSISIGNEAGHTNDALAHNNICIGPFAGGDAAFTSASVGNVLLGFDAGRLVTSGAHNTVIGNTGGGTLTTGDQNVLVGGGADVALASTSNAMAIGMTSIAGARSVVVGSGAQGLPTDLIVIGQGASGGQTGGDIVLNNSSATTQRLVVPRLSPGAGLTGLSYDPTTGIIGAIELAGSGATGTVGGTGTQNAIAVWASNADIGVTNPEIFLITGEGTSDNSSFGIGGNTTTITTSSTREMILGRRNPARGGGTGSITIGYGGSVGASGTDSIAIGLDARTDGGAGVALGPRAQTNSFSTVAIGNLAEANNERSIAIGQLAVTDGQNSVAIGPTATASTIAAVAIGPSATASGGIAIGSSSTASGSRTIAFGSSATASARGAVAMGTGANAGSTGSIAIGDLAIPGDTGGISIGSSSSGTNHANSVVIGTNAFAGGPNCVIIGNGATGSTGNIILIGAGASGSIDGDIILNNAFRTETTQRLIIPDLASGAGLTGLSYDPSTGVIGAIELAGSGATGTVGGVGSTNSLTVWTSTTDIGETDVTDPIKIFADDTAIAIGQAQTAIPRSIRIYITKNRYHWFGCNNRWTG
jgi:hypothetical protein